MFLLQIFINVLYFNKSYLLLGTISVQPWGLEFWKDWGNV